MRAGEFDEGEHVLRAKIDMASGNMNLRDPTLYRIRKATHHRTGDDWCVYPMYDWAHTLSDAIEDITHSLCSLEFEDHRPLYEWILDNTDAPSRPRQIEFARLAITHTMLSKRKLRRLVDEGLVSGWDDPRMPTLSGLRRRGYPPEAIRDFANRVGLTKNQSMTDVAMLEASVREYLNRHAPRRMAVLRPLRVVIENYPEGQVEELEAVNNPEDAAAGTRAIPFSRVLYIERDDFMEDPPKQFFRLAPGREVRLRYAYFLTCREAVKDASGEIVELRCTYDPATRGGNAPDGRKVKATIHWVSAPHAAAATVRLYDRLFTVEDPDGERRGSALTAQPRLAPDHRRRDDRAEPRHRARGRALPVRAARLLLRRSRLDAGPPGLQSQRHAQGRLAEDPAGQANTLTLLWKLGAPARRPSTVLGTFSR